MIFSSFRSLTISLNLILFAQLSSAFWRLPCDSTLTIERVDPIVSTNKVSGHVHTISGSSGFGLGSTFEDLRASQCTSCKVKQDLSVYWTPALYFQWKNGSFTLVNQLGGSLIYYLPRAHSSDKTEVLAFPDGLRMLTGSPSKRSYIPGLMSDAIGWDCIGGSGRHPNLPVNENCPSGLRGEIRFPSCWNGKDTDSADHFSHMAYSDGESGPCPADHPNRIVTLFYEVMWDTNSMYTKYRDQALNPAQPFVLSMGDPLGHGYHGDFFNGWDRNVLQQAIRTCTSDSGVIEECPVFDLQTGGYTCKKTPDLDEIVTGTIPVLPGCNPVTYGPANATSCPDPNPPKIFTNTAAYTGKAPPPGTDSLPNQPTVLESHDVWVYKDCYSDDVSNRALANGLKTANKTVEACLDACKTAGYAYCGVEYHGQCWGDNKISGGNKAIGYGFCDLTCDDNQLQYCGGGTPTAMELYVRGSAPPPPVTTTSTTSKTTTSSTTSTSTTTSPTTSTTTTSNTTSSTTTLATTTRTSSTTTTTSTSVTTSITSTETTATATTTSAPSPVPSKYSGTKWTYSGCFSDMTAGRALPNSLNSNSTIEGCLAAAEAAGFAVAGLSYMGECWAAGALSPASTPLDASKCSMQCKNDKSKTCGGAASLDVYISNSLPVIKSPKTGDIAEIAGYSFKGCYSDLVNNQRTLSKSLSSNSTIEGCISACTKAGFSVCGLEYYGECWGGSALSASSATLDASKCAYPCKNNPLENCGGSAALSVYTVAKTKRAVPPSSFGRRHFLKRQWGH